MRESKELFIDTRHFWYMTVFVGVVTALQAVLFWFTDSFVVVTLPFYLQVAWALIALLLLPAFRRSGPFWSGVTYVILAACAPVALFIDGNYFPGAGLYGNFFRVYLLCAGVFTGCLCLRQLAQAPDGYGIATEGFKGPRLAGSHAVDWLLRLVFAAYFASMFAGVVSIRGDLMPDNMLGFFAGLSPVIAPVVLITLTAGVFLYRRMLIVAGALLNFVYLLLFISEFTSPVDGGGFFDITGAGGWIGMGASLAFLLVLVAERSIFKRPPTQSAEITVDSAGDLAAFPLKWPEIMVFAALAGILFFALVPFSQPDRQARDAVGRGDLTALQQLVERNPEVVDNRLFEQALTGQSSEIVEFLVEKGIRLNALALDPYRMANLLQRHGIPLAQRFVDKGLDLTSPKNLRHLAASTGHGHGDAHREAIQFLLRHRAERGLPLDDFYQPEPDAGSYRSYRSYRFNNPLAIAVERGNSAVIRLIEDAGFRVDDEVLAASIATSDPAANSIEPRLKISGEPQLSRPLAFELLAGRLNEIRVDRYLGLGVDLTETDAEGNNMFHFFASSALTGNAAEYVLKQALAAGCDINRENLSGKKPLWLAVENNRPAPFSLLLKMGADREISAPDGTSLREYCENHGFMTLLIHLD
jgi:hypothetical protein